MSIVNNEPFDISAPLGVPSIGYRWLLKEPGNYHVGGTIDMWLLTEPETLGFIVDIGASPIGIGASPVDRSAALIAASAI